MTESQKLQKLTEQLKGFPGLYWHKIGDTYGGHKKPCDVNATYKGQSFYIEFKNGKIELSDHQREELTKAYDAKACTFLGVFAPGKRDIVFYPVVQGTIIQSCPYCLYWYKGQYTELNHLFENLKHIMKFFF
jgi:hypothetical protein